MDAQRYVQHIDERINDAPFVRPGGSLLIMVGLPGTGKSVLVDKLAEKLPSATVRTDFVRLLMRNHPTYSAAEMMWIYELCQKVIDRRLRRGQRVIFDGTNYLAARRERLVELAERHHSTLAICHVQVSEEVARQRLIGRMSEGRRRGDLSDGDWSVYKWMVEAQEPIDRPHITLDTTTTSPDILAADLRAYWLRCEQNATGNAYLQSSSWNGEF